MKRYSWWHDFGFDHRNEWNKSKFKAKDGEWDMDVVDKIKKVEGKSEKIMEGFQRLVVG